MKTADINPEIKDDELFFKIIELVKTRKPRTIVEIGSSTGLGSTQAFVRGILEAGLECQLCCLECVKPRFDALVRNVSRHPFVHCIRASSVPVSGWMTDDQIAEFWHAHPDLPMRRFSVDMLQRWRREDIAESADVDHDGIAAACRTMRCDRPDMVLIDGSAFSGMAEMKATLGTGTYVLDDVWDIKNWDAYSYLRTHDGYRCTFQNRGVRNGYAVFEGSDV